MVKDFKLSLDPPQQGAYTAGSVVSGTLSFYLKEAKPHYEFIHVKLYGRSHVHWTETIQEGEETREVTHESTEKCANEVTKFWKKESQAIGEGTYSYDFQITIPSKCPSSFEGSDGNIRYFVEARIAKGESKKDHVEEVTINIHSPVDVNESSLVRPVQKTERKQVGCLCCVAGDVELSVEVPRTGFLIGSDDSVPLTVNVENGSSRDMTVQASIVKHHSFHAEQGHAKSSSTDVVVQNSEPIQPRSTVPVELPALKVPSTQPTMFHCSNIKLTYELRVVAEIPWAFDLYVRIPIVLGDTKSSE